MAEGAQSEVCCHFGYVAPNASTLQGSLDRDTMTILDAPTTSSRTEGPPGEVDVFKLLILPFAVLTEGFDYEIALCFHGNTLARQLGSTSLCLPAVSSWSTLITWVPVSLASWVVLENKNTHYLVWRQGRFAYFPQENCSKKVPRLWGFQATAILELFRTIPGKTTY